MCCCYERRYSPQVAEIEKFLDRPERDELAWLRTATNLAYTAAIHSPNRRDWAIYYMLKGRRDELKEKS